VKPDCADGVEGSKTAFTFLQTWLRQVTSDKDQSHSTGAVPQLASRSTGGSSKRRKGRPRKYVAAAGDRTLTGDALLVDTASDSGLARFAVPIPHAPSPSPLTRPATNLTVDQPVPAASQGPSTSGGITPAVKRTKVGRRKDSVFQRGRRQPVKFIPAAERRPPPVKPRRSRSSTVASTTSQAPAAVRAVDGSVKRPRGRPRKHPVVPVPVPSRSIPAAKKAAPDVAVARHQMTDVEGDSSDSDVIVTAYIAPRNVTPGLREPTRETPAPAGGRKRNERTATTSRGQNQRRISEQTVNTEVTQPVKRKPGRPRKYPLPTNATVAVNSSSRRRSSSAAAKRPAAVDKRKSVISERRRVTRALTATQLQNEWNATRLTAAESSSTPARNTPPLYYELSSSDNEEPAPDFRSDVDRRPNNVRRKRKRRRSIPSRSLELSFSSIEKDDVSGGEGAYNPPSGRSRDRESYRAAEMTSTPRYDRSLSTRDSTLRSRWINVEQRAMEMTTTAVVHRDADGKSSSTTVPQSNSTRSAAAATAACQCPGSAVVHRRRRRRGRSSDNEDPDWRRYPAKPAARRPSRNDLGPASTSPASTSPVMTSHSGSNNNEPPMYDEAELDVLVELQRRLASTSDGHVLRQVVEIIEASGRYHVEDATFDFDLCSLDRVTIAKLRRCLAV